MSNNMTTHPLKMITEEQQSDATDFFPDVANFAITRFATPPIVRTIDTSTTTLTTWTTTGTTKLLPTLLPKPPSPAPKPTPPTKQVPTDLKSITDQLLKLRDGSGTFITLVGELLLSTDTVQQLIWQTLSPILQKVRPFFLSLVQSKNPEEIVKGWNLLATIMASQKIQLEFIRICDIHHWGTPGSKTYQDLLNRMKQRTNKKITTELVMGSKKAKVYTVRNNTISKTTNNLETATWMALQEDSGSPWMKYELIRYHKEHLHELLTFKEHQAFQLNAAKETRFVTVEEQRKRKQKQ
jgi:hypothetical protein